MRMAATVVIGDHTQGLGIVRSASMARGAVWVVNDKYISLARFSRYLAGIKQIRRGTLGRLECHECAETLRNTLLEIPFDGLAVLFGVNEDIIRFIHQNRTALGSKYFIPNVNYESIYDKFQFNNLLPEAAKIHTCLCSEIDLGALERPQDYILKGRSGNVFRQITAQKAIRVCDLGLSDQKRLFAQMAPEQIVVQEIIETDRPVLSVCSFSVNGKVVNQFGYEKLRQHPNRFGTGTYLRSTSIEEHRPAAEYILSRLDFTGISEIEFIHDPKTDSYKIIEMNPRTWKSVHFATQCGQNLVAQYVKYLENGRLEQAKSYDLGRYWADLATDIPQMIRELRFWRYHPGFFECTWDPADPLPAIVLWTMFPLIAIENLLGSGNRASMTT
jgi:predicted ATP-grasp superfamily ATP-dependent carboligase